MSDECGAMNGGVADGRRGGVAPVCSRLRPGQDGTGMWSMAGRMRLFSYLGSCESAWPQSRKTVLRSLRGDSGLHRTQEAGDAGYGLWLVSL